MQKIKVTWDNPEQTIIRWDFSGGWSWKDFVEAHEITEWMIRPLNHYVHIMGNLNKHTILPQDMLLQYQNKLENTPPNMGLMVLVGANALVKNAIYVFTTLFGSRSPGAQLVTAESPEEARKIIARHQTGELPRA